MNSFQRICQILKATGFYQLKDDSFIAAEMKAYATVLDNLWEQINEILNSCFLDDPENLWLSSFEDLFGILINFKDDEATKADKIQQMKKRYNVRNTDFSKSAIQDQLRMGGMTATLTENPTNREVQVVITEDRDYCNTQKDKENWIRNAMPCHVVPKITFNS